MYNAFVCFERITKLNVICAFCWLVGCVLRHIDNGTSIYCPLPRTQKLGFYIVPTGNSSSSSHYRCATPAPPFCSDLRIIFFGKRGKHQCDITTAKFHLHQYGNPPDLASGS